jgi:hypothetical protein
MAAFFWERKPVRNGRRKKAAMRDCLARTIETVSKMLVEAITAEAEFVDELKQVDGRMRLALREAGRRAMEGIFKAASEIVTAKEQARGLAVHRRPVVTFHTIFGAVEVESPYLYNTKTRQRARPVHDQLGVRHHGKSQALHRALTDFGAEESFGQAAKRFEEHYGFAVDRTTVLRVVETAAEQAESYMTSRLKKARAELDKPLAERPGVEQMLVEFDGGEIRTGKLEPAPELGTTQVYSNPKRRRTTAWRDTRLGLVRPLHEVTPTYIGKLGSYPEVVAQLVDAAALRGLSQKTGSSAGSVGA